MKYNCLATLNIGQFLTQHSRGSFLAACERWNCDFSEVRAVIKPECPSCSKYIVPELLCGYYKILFVDADTVISNHAPSPFDLCPGENVLCAVSDYQEPNQCKPWMEGPYAAGMSAALTLRPRFKVPPPEQFFNNGVWMCCPSSDMRALFRSALECLPEQCCLWTEQGTINVFAHNSDRIKVCLIPETWNHIIPQDCAAVPEFYINHYGGWAHTLLRSYDV